MAYELHLNRNTMLGVPTLKADEGLNDSDKTLTVPTDKIWLTFSIWIELITTGDAGDRQMAIQWQDNSGDVIGEVRAGIVQPASKTYNYQFAASVGDMTSLRDSTLLTTPMPMIYIPAAYKIRIYDNNAVAAAADDMVIQMMVMELDSTSLSQ